MSITQKDYYYTRAYDEFDINDKNKKILIRNINDPFLSKNQKLFLAQTENGKMKGILIDKPFININVKNNKIELFTSSKDLNIQNKIEIFNKINSLNLKEFLNTYLIFKIKINHTSIVDIIIDLDNLNKGKFYENTITYQRINEIIEQQLKTEYPDAYNTIYKSLKDSRREYSQRKIKASNTLRVFKQPYNKTGKIPTIYHKERKPNVIQKTYGLRPTKDSVQRLNEIINKLKFKLQSQKTRSIISSSPSKLQRQNATSNKMMEGGKKEKKEIKRTVYVDKNGRHYIKYSDVIVYLKYQS